MFRAITLFFFFTKSLLPVKSSSEGQNALLTLLEDTVENKIGDYAVTATRWLGEFNDRNLGDTEFGKVIHYDEIKPKFEVTGRKERSVKKMSMAMMPLIFHVGATSTWMVLTALMAAKSVLIGMALLVFKIAVSSAKVASFFTALKSKHHDHSWTPHYEHGHERSMTIFDHHDWHGYAKNNDWSETHTPEYSTILKE